MTSSEQPRFSKPNLVQPWRCRGRDSAGVGLRPRWQGVAAWTVMRNARRAGFPPVACDRATCFGRMLIGRPANARVRLHVRPRRESRRCAGREPTWRSLGRWLRFSLGDDRYACLRRPTGLGRSHGQPRGRTTRQQPDTAFDRPNCQLYPGQIADKEATPYRTEVR
jgi:hypothetical protein